MAGHNGALSPRNSNQRTSARTTVRSQAFASLLEVARAQGILDQVRTGVSTADALQLCLDRAVAIWEFCVHQANLLAVEITVDEDGHEEPTGFFTHAPTPADPHHILPNKWVAYERVARQDIEQLAASMTQLGIAERQVRVQEAQAALVAASVRDAAMHIGLPPEVVRQLGEALRDRLTDPATRASISPRPDPASGHNTPQVRPHLPSASRSQDPATSRQVGKEGPGH